MTARSPTVETFRDTRFVECRWWNDVIGSVLGLAGPVSVYCDCLMWKVWSAASMSVWQHVNLSEQIRP